MKSATVLLIAVLAAGCVSRSPYHPESAFVDANGDRTITPDELESLLAPRVGAGVGVTLVNACDAFPRDSLLVTPSELRCLERLPVGAGSALPVQDALARPLKAPRPGWLTLVLVAVLVVLLTPVLVNRVVRAAGWFFMKWTAGAWFRLGIAAQVMLSLVAAFLVILGAAAALLLIYVPELRPDMWIGFMVGARREVVAIGVLTLLVAFARAGRIVTASRRLLEIQRSDDQSVSQHPPRARLKNIVICCDGTGNRSRTARDFTRVESNVAKFFDRVLPADQCAWRQSKWYDAGVGTGTSTTSRRVALLGKAASWVGAKAPSGVLGFVEKFRTIMELGFGIGITENVTDGYREIVRQYEPGDRIFLVGWPAWRPTDQRRARHARQSTRPHDPRLRLRCDNGHRLLVRLDATGETDPRRDGDCFTRSGSPFVESPLTN
jgi:hypothetical protein